MSKYANIIRNEGYPENVINQYKELIANQEYELYYFKDEFSNQGMSLIHVPKAIMLNFFTEISAEHSRKEIEFFEYVFLQLKKRRGRFVSRVAEFSAEVIDYMTSINIDPVVRHNMSVDSGKIMKMKLSNFEHPYRLVPWHNQYLEKIAEIIVNSQAGSLDSKINVEFQNIAGTRKLITDIIEQEHGIFDPTILQVLLEENEPVGVCFLIYMRHKAFIPQISISPQKAGLGLGKKLLVFSIKDIIKKHGIKVIELAVTEKNIIAFQLYKKIGFESFAGSITHLYQIN